MPTVVSTENSVHTTNFCSYKVPVHKRSKIDNEYILTEIVAMRNVSHNVPVLVDDSAVNNEQGVTALMDTVNWCSSHVLDLTPHPSGHTETL